MSQLRPLPLPSTPASARLLCSCAVAAIAIGAVHAPAVRAQGFQGTGTVVGGTAVGTITTPAPGQTTVTINTTTNPRAIINWTPSDTAIGGSAIDFLPEGNSALFQGNNNSVSDFIILNRIMPTDSGRVVALNGSVLSRTSNDGGTLGRGNIWFYSPGGILAGANSQFFVGGLLLSANNLTDVDFLDGDNTFSFASTPGSTAAVEISAGAQLAAAGPNSYVALIAPRVQQSGTVTVNGSAALIGAEDVSVTINGTLFDISFNTGTGVGGGTNAVTNDGTISLVDTDSFEDGYGGSMGGAGGARHAILAAVPKNDAITMLVNGAINYTPAAVAFAIDNKVVLAAGYNVASGSIADAVNTPGLAGATIANASIATDVFVQATGSAGVAAGGNGTTAIGGSLTLIGGTAASLSGNFGAPLGTTATISIGGDVTLDVSGTGGGAGATAGIFLLDGSDLSIGGNVSIFANANSGPFDGSGTAPAVVNTRKAQIQSGAATIDIGGNAFLSANANGTPSNSGGDATAGTASVEVGGSGGLTIGGSLTLNANAQGGTGLFGGDATGGTVLIRSAGGAIVVGNGGTGGINASANAIGEVGYGTGGIGGAAQGGSITLDAGSGQISAFSDLVVLSAFGFGGDANSFDTLGAATGGAGNGGDISILSGTGGQVRFFRDTTLLTTGNGGDVNSGVGAGGNGTGGSMTVRAAGGSIVIGDPGDSSAVLALSGSGTGGFSSTAGGSGTGGDVTIGASAGGSIRVTDRTDVLLQGQGNGDGGAGTGGDVTVTAGGGTLSFDGRLDIAAQGTGAQAFNGGNGGVGRGGDISIVVGAGGTATFGDGLVVGAYGEGGYGNSAFGGDAFGGTILVDAAGGGIEIGDPAYGFNTTVTMDASAQGGEAFGGGGAAQGGSAILRLGTVADGTVGGSIFINASATGGRATNARSGDGTAGTAGIEVNGPVSFGGGAELFVEGRGGQGFGGSGTGGNASFVATGGAVTLGGEVRLDADGQRGDTGSFVSGVPQGNGTGGTVTLTIAGGAFSADDDSIILTAIGVGGEEFLDGDAEGGIGQGGTITANFAGGVTAAQIFADVGGFGGRGIFDGGTGAAGSGGNATITFGGTSAVNSIDVSAVGYAGDGGDTGGMPAGNGGAGTGGIAQVNVNGDVTVNSIFVNSDAIGGDGGSGSTESGTSAGGSGGDATGGSAILQVGFAGGTPSLNTSSIGLSANGSGGSGQFGIDGGNGGDGQGGVARMSVAAGSVQMSFTSITARGLGGNGGGVFDTGIFGATGAATGGDVTLELMSGASLTGSSLSLQAEAQGGFGDGVATDGTGGDATLRLAAGSLLDLDSSVTVEVGGEGGFAEIAGSGFGGTITAEFGGTAVIDGDLYLFAEGRGGGGTQAGNGTGGSISIDITGDVNVGAAGEGSGLFVSAAGGGGSAFSQNQVAFGNGIGGTIDFTIGASGALTVGNEIDLYADGAGYENCFFCSNFGAPGGNGTGGTINVTLDGAILLDGGDSTPQLYVSANGLGGFGNQGLGATGQNGGDGIGGTVTLKLGNEGAGVPDIYLSAAGIGGDAGFGFSGEGCCNPPSEIGLDGQGDGPVIFASTPFTGAGGDGIGGTVTVIADGNTVTVSNLQIDASGLGGEGAQGSNFGTTAQFNGGNGGSGTGGSITLRAEDGGELRLLSSLLDVQGRGGDGGDGSESGYGSMAAGIGGTGGAGTGGSIQISVSDSSIVIDSGLTFDASGYGGEGGFGGDNFFDDGYGGSYSGGAGGDGGAGFGGSVSIDITGGFISGPSSSEGGLPDLQLYAIGYGGDGGFGGFSQTGDAGDDGFLGSGAGGLASISVSDLGTAGVGQFGAALIDASGVAGNGRFDESSTDPTTLAGRVIIADAAAPGGLTFDSLAVFIEGADSDGTEFSLTSSNGPVRVLGNFFLNINGQAEFTGTGTGGLSADGDIYVEAGRISLSQTGAAPGAATLSGNNVSLFSVSDIDGTTGSIIGAADVRLSASGAITLASAVAGDDFIADTPGTITVASAVTTGLGPDTDESGYGMDGSNIRLRGGGAIRLDDGSAVNLVQLSSESDSVFSDGTITAESLSISAAIDIALNDLVITNSIGLFTEGGSITGNSFTSGGGISLGAGVDIDLASATSGGDVVLQAAGDATLGDSVLGGGLFAQAQNVTLGDIETTGAFTGGDNGGGIQIAANGIATIASGDSATFIDISAGSVSGGPLTAANSIFVQTSSEGGGTGAITLVNATAGDDIALFADGDISTGVLTAGRDVQLDAGGAATLGGASAGRDLLIDASGAIIVSGAATAGDDIEANGASITFSSATTTGLGEDIGENGYGAGDGSNIRLSGSGMVRLDDGTAVNLVELTSTSGAVVSDGTITAESLSVSSGSDIALNDLVITNSIGLNAAGGSITGNSFTSGGDIALNASGDVDLANATSGGDVFLQAGGDVTLGDSVLGGGLFASGQDVTLGDIETTGAFTGGDNGGGIQIAANGIASIASGDSATFISISAASVSGGPLTAVNSILVQTSTEGGGTGAITLVNTTAGDDIALFADGDVNAGVLTAGQDVVINTGGAVTLGSASAARDLLVDASGAIIVSGAATAGDDIEANGASITFASATTTGLGEDIGENGYGAGDGSNIRLSGTGAVRLDDGSAINLVELNSISGPVVSDGTITAESLSVASGSDIALNDLVITNSIGLNAAGGSITGNSFTSGGDIALNASGDVDLASATSGRDVQLDAGGSIMLGSTSAGRDLLIDASGAIIVSGAATAGDDIEANGASVTFASATTTGLGEDIGENGYGAGDGSNIRLTGSGAVRLDDGTAINLVELTSSGNSVFSDGTITAESLAVQAASNIALNDLVIANSISLFTDNGSVTGNSFTSGGDIAIGASGIIDLASLTSGRDVFLQADGNVSLDGASVGGGLSVAGQNVTLGDIETTGDFTSGDNGGGIQVAAVGTASIASADSATFIEISANNVSSGPLTAASDVSVTGANLSLTGAVIAGGDILVSGVNDVRLDNGTAGGSVTLASTSGAVRSAGTITANSLSVNAATDIAVNNLAINAGIAFNAAGGSITGGDFTTNGGVSLIAANAVAVDTIDAGGTVNIVADMLTADSIFGANIVIDADSVDIGVAQTNGLFDLTTLEDFAFDDISAGAIAIEAASISGNSLTSGSTIDLESTVGGIAVASMDAGGPVMLASAGDITLGDVVARGAFLADASGAFTADTIITLAGEGGGELPPLDAIVGQGVALDGDGVSIAASGDVTVGAIDSAGDVILQSANGDVLVSNDLLAAGFVDAFGQNVTLNAIGSLAVRTAQATAGNVALNSGGLLSLSGAVTGTQITLVSNDIAVGQGAQVGTATGTQAIFITANGGDSTVQLGGTGGQGYTLDNAEFGRFAARDISFDAGGSPLQIGALNVSGANLLRNLAIQGDGPINVTGRVALANASAQNALSIRSGDLLFVDIAGGGISVTDANNGLTGSLDLRGQSILVSTSAAANDLRNANSAAARDARLGINDGAMNPAGVIRAGAISLAASDSIYVQNTGGTTPDSRAGLSAGAGGITLINTNDGDVEVIINGRQTVGTQVFTGQALIAQLSLQGFGEGGDFGLATGSTVNGCAFSATACGAPPPPPPPPPPPILQPDPGITTSVGDLIEIVEGDDSETRVPDIVFNELISIEQAVLAPIIDEPVTGTGNEDVYFGFQSDDDDDEDEDGDIDQQVTGSGNDTLINQPGGNGQQGAPATNDEQVTGSGNTQDGDGN